ncbi:MAG: GNAT family N-acetyltransferase [Bdellovibrionales bacterium]
MILAPKLLTEDHDITLFSCGESVLDMWLRQRALANQKSGASKTYVICEADRVIGYYCLSAGAVQINEAYKNIKRNMPDPIPMMLFGRLAVDQEHQRQGLGRALLRDAVWRTTEAAAIVGIRGIFVRALSHRAKHFYEQSGFRESPINSWLLMISMKEAEAALS